MHWTKLIWNNNYSKNGTAISWINCLAVHGQGHMLLVLYKCWSSLGERDSLCIPSPAPLPFLSSSSPSWTPTRMFHLRQVPDIHLLICHPPHPSPFLPYHPEGSPDAGTTSSCEQSRTKLGWSKLAALFLLCVSHWYLRGDICSTWKNNWNVTGFPTVWIAAGPICWLQELLMLLCAWEGPLSPGLSPEQELRSPLGTLRLWSLPNGKSPLMCQTALSLLIAELSLKQPGFSQIAGFTTVTHWDGLTSSSGTRLAQSSKKQALESPTNGQL